MACCARIIIASVKPRMSITSASPQYITPTRLWSTDVIHSSQRYRQWRLKVIHTRVARIATPTSNDAAMGIGWSKGMADHRSFPSMMPRAFRPRSWLMSWFQGFPGDSVADPPMIEVNKVESLTL